MLCTMVCGAFFEAGFTVSQEEYRKRYDHLYDIFQELEKKKAGLEAKLSKVQLLQQ